MKTLLARLIADLESQRFAPEDVPAARRRLRQLRGQLHRPDSAARRDRHWWRLRVAEEQVRMLLMDYSAAVSIAAEILGAGVGSAIDRRGRLLVEADVLRCCIETQPLEITRQVTEVVFAQDHYADHGLAGHLGQVICGLLAERRGSRMLAEEYYEKAWRTWNEVWCEPVSLIEILTHCAIHSARRRAPDDLAIWIGKIETFHRGYPGDEFRLRFVRLLTLGLKPAAYDTIEAIRRESPNALELLKSIAECAHYWEYTLQLLYLLARVGATELATEWECLLPVRRKFERQLWTADRAWFAACEAQRLPAPDIDRYPLESPPADLAQVKCVLSTTVRTRLVAGYRAAESAALAEDSRLQCGWRQALIGDRLIRLGVPA